VFITDATEEQSHWVAEEEFHGKPEQAAILASFNMQHYRSI
jgi:hypothetical protein